MHADLTQWIRPESSLSGKAWRWRGGNMDMAQTASGGLSDDIITQLLLARGVAREDLPRHRAPTLRAFLPDPSEFRDMELAARRMADAIERREAITIYGDYDVDGATSAALLIRLIRMLGHDARHYIPDRLLEGYGPTSEALVRLGRDTVSALLPPGLADGADIVVHEWGDEDWARGAAAMTLRDLYGAPWGTTGPAPHL